jgi:DNA-binding transcriptional ArsR family regulator
VVVHSESYNKRWGGIVGKDEGEGYNLFKVLSHPTRAKIIELLHENIELSYTEMLNTLKTDTGQLNFHLRNIKGLCETTEDGTYILTDKGKIAYNLMKKRLLSIRKRLF